MPTESGDNIILIISGPAGSGKSTLCDHLTSAFPDSIERFVTTTTRPPRPGEKDGVDYHFLARDVFMERIREDGFYEWAEVHGNLYGTERARVRERLRGFKDLLLNIDVQGAEAFRRAAETDPLLRGRLVTVFVKPRTIGDLRERLLRRGSEDDTSLARRLQTAIEEIPEADKFNHTIVSGSKADDASAIEAVYKARGGKA
ncbi:MAG: guanylate kinase [Opitutales bacterium]|nr:guanylate kinase [Opitutales bacterium]